MNFKSFRIILSRHIRAKKGRFILASLGIAVGVWAVTMTTALSFGVSDTLIGAINSQPEARQGVVFKFAGGQTSFTEVFQDPFTVQPQAVSVRQANQLSKDISGIQSIVPMWQMEGRFCLDSSTDTIAEYISDEESVQEDEISEQIPPGEDNITQNGLEVFCDFAIMPETDFDTYYELQKNDWTGNTQALQGDQIALAIRDDSPFLQDAKDFIGSEFQIVIEMAPSPFLENQILDIGDDRSAIRTVPVYIQKTVTLAAVTTNDPDMSFDTEIIFGQEGFRSILSEIYPNTPVSQMAFTDYQVYVDDFENVDSVYTGLQDAGYLPFFPLRSLVNGLETVFQVLAWVMAGFGVIALVASVFGIVNMMIISTIERRKEIGIIKSLGSLDKDVFLLFLIESMMLGIFGWLLGILAALGFGRLISWGFQLFIQSNESIRSDLAALDITAFNLAFPWWLFVLTLLLALVFTGLSGVYPALRASKQDPADVLRSQ